MPHVAVSSTESSTLHGRWSLCRWKVRNRRGSCELGKKFSASANSLDPCTASTSEQLFENENQIVSEASFAAHLPVEWAY